MLTGYTRERCKKPEIEIERLISKQTGPLAPLFLQPPSGIEIWDGNA